MDEMIKEYFSKKYEGLKESYESINEESERLEALIEKETNQDEKSKLYDLSYKNEIQRSKHHASIWAAWLEMQDIEKEKKESFILKCNEFKEWYNKEISGGIHDICGLEGCIAYLPIMDIKTKKQGNSWYDDYARYSASVSEDSQRNQLQGMCVTFDKDGIEYASTDGRRVFVTKTAADENALIIPTSHEYNEKGNIIASSTVTTSYKDCCFKNNEGKDITVRCILKPISKKLVETLGFKCQEDINNFCENMKDEEYSQKQFFNIQKVLKGDDLCALSIFGKSYVPIWHNGTVYAPVDGVYPNYKQVIPDYSAWQKIEQVERLIPNLRVYKILRKFLETDISQNGWRLEIGSIDIHINAEYFLSGILQVGGHVTMHVKDSTSPVVLTNHTDDSMYMLMPMARGEKESKRLNVNDRNVLESILPEYNNTITYRKGDASVSKTKTNTDTKKVIDVVSETNYTNDNHSEVKSTVSKTVKLVADIGNGTEKEETKKMNESEKKEVKNERVEVKCSSDPNSFNQKEMDALNEKRKYLKYYGEGFQNISALEFINKLWNMHKFSLKTTPKKNEEGLWKITCEALFDEVSFKYGLYLINGGKMIKA